MDFNSRFSGSFSIILFPMRVNFFYITIDLEVFPWSITSIAFLKIPVYLSMVNFVISLAWVGVKKNSLGLIVILLVFNCSVALSFD